MGKVVLVVDDSISIRKLVGRALLQAGFEVMEATNGKEGLSRLADKAASLVITDINMPVMDGLEFIRAMRADAKLRFVPVLVLTTEVDPAKQGTAHDIGATGWIVKPFQADKLLTVVNRLVA